MTASEPNEPNPYADQLSDSEPTHKSNAQDQSVFAEPWMQQHAHFTGDEYSDAMVPTPDTSDVEHTVWDEPALSPSLAGETPDDALTWSKWYQEQQANTSLLDTWLITLLLTVLAGPLALLTAWLGYGSSTIDLLVVVVLVPAAEELLKVALPLWVVEKRPHLFCAPFQILLCTFCSGLIFGALRFVFAIKLFNPFSAATVTGFFGGPIVSTAMHALSSLIAGFALVQIWREAAVHNRRPDLTRGTWFGAVAILLHIGYAAIAFGLLLVAA